MAKVPETNITYKVSFAYEDAEGTAPVRTVAGHAQRVAEGWAALSEAMFDLADSLDRLVAGSEEVES